MLDWDEVQVINRLIDGLTEDNALARLRTLLDRLEDDDWHVQALVSGPHPLRAGPSYLTDTWAEALLEASVAALKFTATTDVPSHEVEAILSPADSPTRERLWIAFGLERNDQGLLVSAIQRAFGTRMPTADDVRALERVDTDRVEAMVAAVPSPPTASEVHEWLERSAVPAEVISRWVWLELAAPDRADWAEVSAILANRYGPITREGFVEPPPQLESFVVTSPINVSELQGRDPMEVARIVSSWRRSPQEYRVGSRELARTLQQVVESDAQAWNVEPVEYAAALREPIYIAHFLQGMAQAVPSLESPRAGSLVEAIRLADSEPWEPNVLGSEDWDYDSDWDSCRDASVDLLEALAKTDVALGESYEFVWAFLERLTRDTTRGSGILSESDPMTLAINRACTRAFRALLNLAASRHRLEGVSDQRLPALLEWALSIEGSTGLQFRAVLAPWLPYLRQLLPEWVERVETHVYSEAEPLGLETLALAIRWSKPDRYILESQRPAVLELVRRREERALDHVFIAMLREMEGYDPIDLAQELDRLGPEYISAGGERCARLLREADIPENLVELGVRFWRAVLDAGGPAERFRGFGWWADVHTLEDQVWRPLMLQTIREARGSLDWAEQVAERLLEQIDEDTLEALDWLISGVAEPWERGRIAQLATERAHDLQALADTDRFRALNRTLMMFGFPVMPAIG